MSTADGNRDQAGAVRDVSGAIEFGLLPLTV
jgi:hypothetical protein